jgi:hypothetical protein
MKWKREREEEQNWEKHISNSKVSDLPLGPLLPAVKVLAMPDCSTGMGAWIIQPHSFLGDISIERLTSLRHCASLCLKSGQEYNE